MAHHDTSQWILENLKKKTCNKVKQSQHIPTITQEPAESPQFLSLAHDTQAWRNTVGTLLVTLNLLLILHVESFLHNDGWSSCVFLFLREFSPGSDHSLSWGGIFLQRDLENHPSFPQTSNLFQLRATRELIRLARQTSKKKRKIQRWIRCWYVTNLIQYEGIWNYIICFV